MQPLSDEILVSRYVQENDTGALGILFKRYAHLVLGVCLKYLRDEDTAKDATSQIFEKLMVDLKKHSINTFRPWLYTVAKNHCYMQLRAGKKEISGLEPRVMEWAGQQHLSKLGEPDALEKESQLHRMEQALLTLEPHQQSCLRLFYLEEKSYQEISVITGYTLLQVKSYIQNGKRNLKNILIKNGEGAS